MALIEQVTVIRRVDTIIITPSLIGQTFNYLDRTLSLQYKSLLTPAAICFLHRQFHSLVLQYNVRSKYKTKVRKKKLATGESR